MVDLERQLVITAAAEHGDLRRRNLDVAGGELRVFAGALAHDARNGNRGFLIEGLYNVHHLFVFDDNLRRAENDYKVNLKTEIMIEDLYDKVNAILAKQKALEKKLDAEKSEKNNKYTESK